jgi:hypothetical protein
LSTRTEFTSHEWRDCSPALNGLTAELFGTRDDGSQRLLGAVYEAIGPAPDGGYITGGFYVANNGRPFPVYADGIATIGAAKARAESLLL